MTECSENLRCERMALCIGTVIGQISELLNSIKDGQLNVEQIYHSLFDIHRAAGLQVHELFYKGNKP